MAQSEPIFQVQYSVMLSENPEEYQNDYRITIMNNHQKYQDVHNVFKKDYSTPTATTWHGIFAASNKMSRLAAAKIINCMLPVA